MTFQINYSLEDCWRGLAFWSPFMVRKCKEPSHILCTSHEQQKKHEYQNNLKPRIKYITLNQGLTNSCDHTEQVD